MTIDLAAYLRRIGLTAEATPTTPTLAAIVAAHAAAIPFENLDPLVGRVPDLQPAALEQKLVHGGRGGYCFEHNLLLMHALRQIGFDVRGLAARVLWNRPPDAITPRSHMLLLVDLDGPHLVDVGFGGLTLTGVLRLETGTEQPTPHGPFRLGAIEGAASPTWAMQANIAGDWRTLYRFDLSDQHQVDYEVSNFYLATLPTSHFRTGLMAARAAPDRRYALSNRSFAVHPLGGATERRVLETTAELRAVLEEHFLVRLPAGPELDAALERLPRG